MENNSTTPTTPVNPATPVDPTTPPVQPVTPMASQTPIANPVPTTPTPVMPVVNPTPTSPVVAPVTPSSASVNSGQPGIQTHQPAQPVVTSPDPALAQTNQVVQTNPPPAQKSKFKSILLAIVLFLMVVGIATAGYFAWQGGMLDSMMGVVPEESMEAITPVPDDEMVACTLDAFICPDGTAVGRVPPSCEFAECPAESAIDVTSLDTSTWVKYEATLYSFMYPANWTPSAETTSEDGNSTLVIFNENEKNIMENSTGGVTEGGLQGLLQNKMNEYQQSSFTQNPILIQNSPFQISDFPTSEISYTATDGQKYRELFAEIGDAVVVNFTLHKDDPELLNNIVQSFVMTN